MSSMGILALVALVVMFVVWLTHWIVFIKFESRVSPPRWAFTLNKRVLIPGQYLSMILTPLTLILVVLHGCGVHPHLHINL